MLNGDLIGDQRLSENDGEFFRVSLQVWISNSSVLADVYPPRKLVDLSVRCSRRNLFLLAAWHLRRLVAQMIPRRGRGRIPSPMQPTESATQYRYWNAMRTRR
jgi:hypothetical protein